MLLREHYKIVLRRVHELNEYEEDAPPNADALPNPNTVLASSNTDTISNHAPPNPNIVPNIVPGPRLNVEGNSCVGSF
jgi:hypothetical protein